MSKTIDKLIETIEKHHIIIDNKTDFLNFFFEYACELSEWQGIDPKTATTYVEKVIVDRLKRLAIYATINYVQRPREYVNINSLLKQMNIANLVRREHGGGIRVNQYRQSDSYDDWLEKHSNTGGVKE